MKEGTRCYLKKGSSISLCRETSEVIVFKIGKILGAGGSVISYEASNKDTGKGVLREFYPEEISYAVQRNKNGQLIADSEFEAECKSFFEEEGKKYIRAYEKLLGNKKNFIPPFCIYQGYNKNKEEIKTIYIWTPTPESETFKDICENMWDEWKQQVDNKREKKAADMLRQILELILSLTNAVCDLHKEGLFHRDIKPSNFGFHKRLDKVEPETLELFDINTICGLGSSGYVYSEGFSEPKNDKPDNKTDIYSIGACLFYALVGDDYKKDYDELHKRVKDSEFVASMNCYYKQGFIYRLTDILRKCLAENRKDRYACCEELINDLNVTLNFLKPNFKDEKYIESTNLSDSIPYHLYKYPLYKVEKALNDGSHGINILILGFNNYGQVFLDACLQAGQMLDRNLNVKVIPRDCSDKDRYLDARPALKKFFCIDQKELKDSYGKIQFLTDVVFEDSKQVEKVLSESPVYALVDLGDNQQNQKVAEIVKSRNKESIVSCAMSSLDEKVTIIPVCMMENADQRVDRKEIERMAFNAHLVWEKNLNIDQKTIKNQFRKAYNHDSSISCVLSIKYMLYSIGIHLNELGYEKAAAKFTEKLSEYREKLGWIEHRRWVTEKVCAGWQTLEDLDYCVKHKGVTQNKEEKLHICIVRSKPEQELKKFEKIKWDEHKGDTPSWEELKRYYKSLDELERMSIMLHIKFANYAKTYESSIWEKINDIKKHIDEKSQDAFAVWNRCINDICDIDDDNSGIYLYEGLKEKFLNSVDIKKKKVVGSMIDELDEMFYPIMESKKYQDFKQNDFDIIDNIPFILTYSTESYMVIPYVGTDIIANVAAATFVNPKKILYLYRINKESDKERLLESVPRVIRYMENNQIKSDIEFGIVSSDSGVENYIEDQLKEKKLDRIKKVSRIVDQTKVDAYLKNRSRGKDFFVAEINETKLSQELLKTYEKVPAYRFQYQKMEFSAPDNCNKSGYDKIKYIHKTPYIRIAEIFVNRKQSVNNDVHLLAEYEKLWKIYSDHRTAWKALCKELESDAHEHGVFGKFKGTKDGKYSEKPMEYILPFTCARSADKIIGYLRNENIVGTDSRVDIFATDSCKASVYIKESRDDENQKQCDKIFSRVYELCDSDAIEIDRGNDGAVDIKSDNLIAHVSNITVERKELLKELQREGYIHYSTADGEATIIYGTRQIKNLLLSETRILELYTHCKVKECGKFDDVVSKYGCEWRNDIEEKEKIDFDFILKKNFQMMFVKCKTNEMEDFWELMDISGKWNVRLRDGNNIGNKLFDEFKNYENQED